MQRRAIWASFLCLKPLSLTKSSCTCLTGTLDNSSASFVAIHFFGTSSFFYHWEMVSPVEKGIKPILVNTSWLWHIIGKHVKYLFEYKQVPKINTVHTCCVGLHTPKTHAVIVYRPNLEDPRYCDYYFIPGDSGIQERCSKLNTMAA